MDIKHFALLLCLAGASASYAQHQVDEEIVVSAPFQKSSVDSTLPINLLSGEALARQIANSLGESLKRQPGVHSGSFGAGVSTPIIRGQSGNRVQILQNSVTTLDASDVSPDHATGLEPLIAERIEIIRGPATLLFGNGAIGGIVNVIDNRIPETIFDSPSFTLQQSRSSVSDGDKTVFKGNASLGKLSFHVDGVVRDNDNVDINGLAIDEYSITQLELLREHDHEDEQDEEGHDEHEEEEGVINSRGFIANSDGESDSINLGASYILDDGFIGLSYQEIDNRYGLPPGAHAHDEHEGAEENEHDEEETGATTPNAQEFVRIDLKQQRLDLGGEWNWQDTLIERVRFGWSQADYEHTELEIEPDGTTLTGTRFSNDGHNGRVTLDHRPSGVLSGTWGLQWERSDFSAIGEEAFIPASDIERTAAFIVERVDLEQLAWEIGGRLERSEISTGRCQSSETTVSVSSSLLYRLTDQYNLVGSVARSERAPTVEELFSNIDTTTCSRPADNEDLTFHFATGLLEVGNSQLDPETSRNVELALRKTAGAWTGELNVYYNDIRDYIFLRDTGVSFEEQPIAIYESRDATFAGLEARLSRVYPVSDRLGLEVALQADHVRARFKDANVPRIPPGRVGIEFTLAANPWTLGIGAQRVDRQSDTAEFELNTDGYTDVTAYADYHWALQGGLDFQVFARGENLLDEEIRNHTSFVKNFAPQAGRNITLGVTLSY